jgi:hypothetical protein
VSKQTYYRGKRGLIYGQKRPNTEAKETCYLPCTCMAPLSPIACQKRPTIEAKETYYRGKRDLQQRQKRPTAEAKETYYRGKRDLL